MAGILEGIRVIDMGQVGAVPAARAIMADLGAEVIKVEPLTGEIQRGVKMAGTSDINWAIQLLNRNKKEQSSFKSIRKNLQIPIKQQS